MKRTIRLSIIATHPIQYHIPWFRALASCEELDLTVYFALLPDENQQGVGFGIPFAWDIPMLDGYKWEKLPNAVRSPSLLSLFSSSTPKIFDILKATNPDAVICTGWQPLPLLQALWACKKLHIKCIVRGESNLYKQRPWYIKELHRLVVPKYDAFLAIGKANEKFYLHYGIDRARIFKCLYFVDNARFAEQRLEINDKRHAIRTEWGIPEKSVCFLFAGKLTPKKRILDLLKALAMACRSKSAMHLLIVGSGKLMEAARRITADRHLPATFAGFLNQTQMAKAYAAADCLILPSDSGETWGLVVNEAMACGLPAIVSDQVGCGPDLIIEGATGNTFPCGDIGALTDKLIETASNPGRLIHMGQQAKEHIKKYSVEEAVKGTVKAIDYVVKK